MATKGKPQGGAKKATRARPKAEFTVSAEARDMAREHAAKHGMTDDEAADDLMKVGHRRLQALAKYNKASKGRAKKAATPGAKAARVGKAAVEPARARAPRKAPAKRPSKPSHGRNPFE